MDARTLARCEPVYREVAGWGTTTLGARRLGDLPSRARAYLKRIETLAEAPVHHVSTGPERGDTIIGHHPFGRGGPTPP